MQTKQRLSPPDGVGSYQSRQTVLDQNFRLSFQNQEDSHGEGSWQDKAKSNHRNTLPPKSGLFQRHLSSNTSRRFGSHQSVTSGTQRDFQDRQFFKLTLLSEQMNHKNFNIVKSIDAD